jgi:transposase
MPALADVQGAALSVVDVVTDDAPAVPPVPAGRLDVEHAKALTERIRLTAQTTRERLQRLAELVEQARAGEVADVLGYASWTAYLADVLGGQMRLDGADRRELVGYLTDQGMSTRAIAPIVGASPKTVARDVAATRVSGDTPEAAAVTGRDGKVYAPREVCPVCGRHVADLGKHLVKAKCSQREAGYQAAAERIRQDAAARFGAEQPPLEGMPEPIALPVAEEPTPWLIVTQTPAMAKGAERVHQCAYCGTVVVTSSLANAPGGTLGACPACGAGEWWEQRFPVAGIDLAATA